MPMPRACEAIVAFVTAATSPRGVAAYQPSEAAEARAAGLIRLEKTTSLSPEETVELERYLELEHVMRLVKARSRTHLTA